MDKNKSRTDLLAAGRKKLQQFRQKKEGKGGSSHGRSSKKSGKSEQHDGDGDGDAASSAAKPMESLNVHEREMMGSSHLDSDVGYDDLPVSHSKEDPVVPDMDIATVKTLLVPAPLGTPGGEMGIANNFGNQVEGSDISETGLVWSGGKECDNISFVPNEGESSMITEAEVAGVTSSGTYEVAVSEGESMHATCSTSVDFLAPPSFVAAEGVLVTVDTGSMGRDDERKALPFGQDFSAMLLSQEKGDQGTGCSDLKQLDSSSGAELGEDGRLALPKLAEDAETFARVVSGVSMVEESVRKAEQTSPAVLAGDGSDVFSVSVVTTEEDGALAMGPGMAYNWRDVVRSSSIDEKSGLLSVAGDFGSNQEVTIQAGATEQADYGRSIEGHSPKGSYMSKGENRSMPLIAKTARSSGGETVVPGEVVSSISLSQLVDVLKGLDEDEFQHLLKWRDSVSNAGLQDTGSYIVREYNFNDFSEALKEQLFLTNITKDIFILQLLEQSKFQMECDCQQRQQLDDKISMLSSLLNEVDEMNKNLAEDLERSRCELQAVTSGKKVLEEKFQAAKSEVADFSATVSELHNELERSQADFLRLASELANCKSVVEALQVENANLSGILTSEVEERSKHEEEKKHFVNENEKLSLELVKCKSQVAAIQVENADLGGTLASLIEERKKFENEKEYLVCVNDKLLTQVADCQGLLVAVFVENANISGIHDLLMEDMKKLEEEKHYFVCENEKLKLALAECQGLVAAVHVENASLREDLLLVTEERKKLEKEKEYCIGENRGLSSELCVHRELSSVSQAELRELNLRYEQLTEENIYLNSSLNIYKGKIEEINNRQTQYRESLNRIGSSDVLSRGVENVTDDGNYFQASDKQDGGFTSPMLERKPGSDDYAGGASSRQLEQDVCSDSFEGWKGRLQEAENIINKLEKAIAKMHSDSAFFSGSGGKIAASGVSKLIQAFETNAHADDHEIEENILSEDRSIDNPFLWSKEHIGNLRAVLKELGLDADKGTELLKGERNGREVVYVTCKELKGKYEAMREYMDNLEAINIELEVQYEALKQYGFCVEEKKTELGVLNEILQQQTISLKEENCGLGKKLTDCQSRISQLHGQLLEIRLSSEESASSISNKIEHLQNEATEKLSKLEQVWDSTVAHIIEIVGKLDASSGRFSVATMSDSADVDLDLGSRVAASVSAATKLIENLVENLEAAHADHESMCSSNKEVKEKVIDLQGKNELAVGILHKLYSNLRTLAMDSSSNADESEMNIHIEESLDPLHLSRYESLMEKLGTFLGERLQLESENKMLSTELNNKTKDVEELIRRCVDLDVMLKLLQDVERVVKAEDVKIDFDKPPALRLESFVSFLLQRYIEADERVKLAREDLGSMATKFSELQEKISQLSSVNFQQENEITDLKGTLRREEEGRVAICSELQEKVTELEQSDQRASSFREKLSIAVAKGKGLIVQRDNLKQSLAETSIELERCSQELQWKDARLHEVETKLKTYAEAGERVEALESELSYIRNSATGLRESFLLKDSVLQRIEEILEDLDLPEGFHSRDVIEKVDWLARSVTGNSLPLIDWDGKRSVEGGLNSDSSFVVMDGWKEDMLHNSDPGEDSRSKYEELQSKFYGLAEQNAMLEQSLLERNNLLQRWEEVLDRISMPTQLRSMEPEDQIKWLGSALSEAHHSVNSLEQKIDNLEDYCRELSADLQETQSRLSEVEVEFQVVTHEKEHLSKTLETLTCDYEKVLDRTVQFEVENDKLQNEIIGLREKLVANQEQVHGIEGEIRRLIDLVSGALQDTGSMDLVSCGSNIECLEGLLKKLLDCYTSLSLGKPMVRDAVNACVIGNADTSLDEARNRDTSDVEEMDVLLLKKELEKALNDLMHTTQERDSYMEKDQRLVCEVEALNKKREELEELLSQEEQKSASVREKLNIAVRKGKSLVQQRDILKQSIEEMNEDVDSLKVELSHRENALAQYEQKIKELSSYPERIASLESETLSLRNCLTETEHFLQEKGNTLDMIFNTIRDIDAGGESSTSDPIGKLEQLGKVCGDLHAAVASSGRESKNFNKAAEVLLAELKEFQERNDGLQEKLAKVGNELLEISKERDMAEASKLEALSRLENLSSVYYEERKSQYTEFMALKSMVDQLWRSFFDVNNLLADIFSKDMELLHNLEANMELYLKSNGSISVVSVPFDRVHGDISSYSENQDKFRHREFWSEIKMQEHLDDSVVVEVCRDVGHHLQGFTTEIGALKEQAQKHSILLDEEAGKLLKIMETAHGQLIAKKESRESLQREIIHIESLAKEKDMENVVLRKNIALLYESCSGSIMEIENRKAHLYGIHLPAGDLRTKLKSTALADGGHIFSGQTLLSFEDQIRTVADELLMAVKDMTNMIADIVQDSQVEMKTTIANLQNELQEKDIQRDRICMELVSQIREAEASATSYSADLHSARTQVLDLEKCMEVMAEERKLLDQKVKQLQDGVATPMELQERVTSMTDVLAAKDEEIESLMQALDEEVMQMEELTNKIVELEKILHQKNIDLENLEISRGKAVKKLSVTVSKFDELHNLSASLLAEVEKLQSQLQDRDAEISFLRQEVTRCTNDVLAASQMSNERNSGEINELLTWLNRVISRVQVHDVHLDDMKGSQIHESKEILQKQIASIISELEDLRSAAQSKDTLIQIERSRVEELTRKQEFLENSLNQKETQLNLLKDVWDSGEAISITPEVVEVEPMINKWTAPGTSVAPKVRSLRKVNNDHVAIAIDVDSPSNSRLEDEDDDKVHGFKSLATSKIVPRFTRPVTDMIDGLWVSCDRALMRQPALRLCIIIYWAVMHALLATFIV